MIQYNQPPPLLSSLPQSISTRKIYSSSSYIPSRHSAYTSLNIQSPKKYNSNKPQPLHSHRTQPTKEPDIRYNLSLKPSFFSTSNNFSKCKSQREIRHNHQTIHLEDKKKKIEIVQKQKQSLNKWKIIRNMRRIQESKEKKVLEQELRERRRESYMENLWKKKCEQEEKQFVHSIKDEWIKTLKRERLRSSNGKRTIKVNKSKKKYKTIESKDGLNRSVDKLKSTYQSTNYDSHKFYNNLGK